MSYHVEIVKPIKAIYTLHNPPLSVVDQATYLGVEIAQHWAVYLSSKASQSLGFLRCNIHSSKLCTKEAAYNSIVRPTLEYSSSVWNPYHQKDIDKIEDVQRQATRFVTTIIITTKPQAQSPI
jgi:hypothetical protein